MGSPEEQRSRSLAGRGKTVRQRQADFWLQLGMAYREDEGLIDTGIVVTSTGYAGESLIRKNESSFQAAFFQILTTLRLAWFAEA